MNQIARLRLYDVMGRHEGWGRDQGRVVYPHLLRFVELHPGVLIFRISVDQVQRMDISFVSETIVQLARRYRGRKGFCFNDLSDRDMLENCVASAERGEQPLLAWDGDVPFVVGPQPSPGTSDAFRFALRRPKTRVAEFVTGHPEITIANASNKFKQLWERGFLLREERSGNSGGVEYLYQRIQ